MIQAATTRAVPRAGMLATVRNRRGVVVAVEPFDGETGRLHLVHLEYKDNHAPNAERVLWELERDRALLEPTALPEPARADAMPPEDFDALLRAARWTALSPYIDPDRDVPLLREAVASPFHGAVQVEDYQLVPLMKALRMPRVSLLIADDVGLGKTVEAGLIVTELLLRRRIRRVLVLAPASLRQQWRDELWEKFSLRFEIVGRYETERLRRRFGMDANPWRSFNRIVASYHYLRQPDVREQFLAACHAPENSPHLPWDLLIVDECHNLMPAPFGEDSELCRTLRLIAPRFEHRLFLSATPHNGHTRSFTGLLEILDPVRFNRTHELSPAMRRRIDDVVIRRLKRDINRRAASPRFCNRLSPKGLSLDPGDRELALSEAFDAFRGTVKRIVAGGTKQRRRAGTFAIEILGKRLLSAPVAFAESWRRARQGLAEQEAVPESEVATAERALRKETSDDREIEQLAATAATVTGAWLKNFGSEVRDQIRGIENALEALGFDLGGDPIIEQTPLSDIRFSALVKLIEGRLHKPPDQRADYRVPGDEFLDEERLIVFTEYKTTLDYLARRLRERYPGGQVLTLFGGGGTEGMNEADREQVKAAFNDPDHPVRILVATDAASEGLNLHRTARYLLHYDCPWNPSRLEQRNGRLDRYGQARDVSVHHFVSDSDPDLRFLDHVIRKADEIREDLGSVNEIFDRAMHQRLIQGEDTTLVQNVMYQSIEEVRGSNVVGGDGAATLREDTRPEAMREADPLRLMAAEIDLDGEALGNTLEAAMATSGGRPQLQSVEEAGLYRLVRPDLGGWRDVIDDAVRVPVPGGGIGSVPQLAFDPAPFVQRQGTLDVFQTRRDALLIHLGHPLMQRALGVLARRRYPGEQQVSRWTVRRGDVPSGFEAMVLLSVEELAVNELRETFHRWVRTLTFPVREGELGEPLPHVPARDRSGAGRATELEAGTAGQILEDVTPALRQWLREAKRELTETLRTQLQTDGLAARKREEERYRSRQGELSTLVQEATLARLSSEIQDLQRQASQGMLFEETERLAAIEQSIDEKQAEIDRRLAHCDELRDQLRRDHERIVERLLPLRFAMSGDAQIFPVAVEIRLPGK